MNAQSKAAALGCIRCGAPYPADVKIDSLGCPSCREVAPSNLEVLYSAGALARRGRPVGDGVLDFLPVRTLPGLGEGNTPLLKATELGRLLDLDDLWIKDESRNPTWSHKDRFSAVAVAHARDTGHRLVATASSGNAGASLAAYAAKAGLASLVLTFDGAAGPLANQARAYGATLVSVPNKALRWTILAEGAACFGWFVTSPFAAPAVGSHPYGIEGYKTIAYEIATQSPGRPPGWVIVPAAYGDLLRGVWRGFLDLQNAGLLTSLPRMVAAEVYGSAARTLAAGSDRLSVVADNRQTRALSIGTRQGTFQTLATLRDSGGGAETVDDAAMERAQTQLAHREGLLGELSGVAAIAAAAQLRKKKTIGAGERVVCVMTASGLKDFDPAPRAVERASTLKQIVDILAARVGSIARGGAS